MKQKSSVWSIFVIVWGLFFVVPVLAQNPPVQVTMSTSTTRVHKNEDFSLTIQIKKADQDGNVVVSSKGIEIPGLENFAQIGTSNTTNMKIVNGQSLVLSDLTKMLVPQKVGEFTLGPVKIPIKNKEGRAEFIESNTIQITVIPGEKEEAVEPPLVLGDNTGLFEPEKKVSISLIPKGNWQFWLQIGGMVIVLWAVWFFVNKKIEQKRNPTATQNPTSSQSETEKPLKKKVEIKLPLSDAPDFLETVHKVMAHFCVEKLDLHPAKITQKEILPQAKAHLSADNVAQLQEILQTYEKTRFARLPIDRQVFLDRLELFLRKNQSL